MSLSVRKEGSSEPLGPHLRIESTNVRSTRKTTGDGTFGVEEFIMEVNVSDRRSEGLTINRGQGVSQFLPLVY